MSGMEEDPYLYVFNRDVLHKIELTLVLTKASNGNTRAVDASQVLRIHVG